MTHPTAPTFAQTLITATLAPETAFLAAMEAGLQMLAQSVPQPGPQPRSEVQQERDYDNLPV